jgi:hypothetical protein
VHASWLQLVWPLDRPWLLHCNVSGGSQRCGAAFTPTNTLSNCANLRCAPRLDGRDGCANVSGGDNTSSDHWRGVGRRWPLHCVGGADHAFGVMCRRQKLVGDVNLRDVETMSVSQGNYGSTASMTQEEMRRESTAT